MLPAGLIAERRLIQRLLRSNAVTSAEAQPLADLRYRCVHCGPQFPRDFAQFLTTSFAVRDAPDFEASLPVSPTDMLEAQEGERFRFALATLGPVGRCKAPESDQLGLVFIQFQLILSQTLL